MSKRALFDLGRVVFTAAVDAHCKQNPIARYGAVIEVLTRHASGDFGDVVAEDWQANEQAVDEGYRVFSAYKGTALGDKVWVITEADRSATTVLYPEDY